MKGTVKENREFVYAYRRGKKTVSRTMVVHCCRNRTGETRLGITVSKAVGKANKRNRAKRLVRECWRQALPQMKPGYNVIVVARGKLAEAALAQAQADFAWCLQKLELVKP